MPRSLKKGPFIDGHLQKKVDDQNAKGTKTVIKTKEVPVTARTAK